MRFVMMLVMMLVAAVAHAQPDPTTLPLVQPADVRYVGRFTLPQTDGTGRPAAEGWLTWGGTALGLGPDGTSLYYGCHDWGKRLARVSIPAIGGVGAVVEPCAPIANLTGINPQGGTTVLGGSLAWGGRAVVSAYTYYDASSTATASHFVGQDVATLAGPHRVGTQPPGFVGGYMGVVPPEWRARLGGPALTGQCCLAIVGRSSHGPSVSVFDPAALGGASPTPATMLVGYDNTHPLGPWGTYNPLFTGSTAMGGVAFPSGTRSVLFVGVHGGTFCYGSGTSNQALAGQSDGQGNVYCYDPTSSAKGTHGYPYQHQVWAYDANDLAAVKVGTKQPWDVRPYAVWPLSGVDATGTASIRSAAYDDTVRRIYMTTSGGESPAVHIFEVASKAPSAEQPPPTITVDPAITHQTMRGWEMVVAGDVMTYAGYAGWREAALDRAVEAGIDRVRLEVRAGVENPTDQYGAWRAAGYPFSGSVYTTWRAKRYETVNDNADPNVINPAGFHWTELDLAVTEMVNPLRAKLAAKGENLYVNLNYVAFVSQVTSGAPYVHQSPDEYAEFAVAAFQHMQSTFGWVPDGLEVILEPDNTGSGPWTAARLDAVIAATVPRLAAAGFTPDIIAPSTVWMSTASTWWDALSAPSRAAIKELSYHRYGGVSAAHLAAIASRHPAPAMLEYWDVSNTFATLHDDLTNGRNAAWQAGVITGGTSTTSTNITILPGGVPTFSPRTQFVRRYFQAVRRGAVRVGATSTDARFAPVAFRNADGRYAVVVKATAPGTATIGGLPAGTYGIDFTTSATSSVENPQTGSRPDQTITAGQTITVDVPWGVTVIYLRVATPVACVETAGPWGPGPDADGWSSWVVSGTEETRYRERAWTQTIAAANGGAACAYTTGGLGSTFVERVNESRPYTPPPPPPPPTPVFACAAISDTEAACTVTWQGRTFTIRLTVQ